jgi:hypothetical protein
MVTGTPTSTISLPIYVGKYDAWQIQGQTNVQINVYPPITFYIQPTYTFFQYQAANIQLNANGGDNSEYTWLVEDECIMNLESNEEHVANFSVSTETVGSFECDVICQQTNFPENEHSEQVNISIEGSFWAVDPLALVFPSTETILTVTLTNTTVNGSPFNYTLNLSSSAYYDILSNLSGNLSSGEHATIEVMSFNNNNPYELSAQLQISINSGAYNSIVELTTQAACSPSPGDVNNDSIVDVLDIVATVAYVMGTLEFDSCQFQAGELSGDGSIDVLDIIIMVGLAIPDPARAITASQATIIKTSNGLQLEALVEGLQMELKHGPSFELELSPAWIADYVTRGTVTRVIIIHPESNQLFTTSSEFEIVSLKAVSGNNYLPVNIIEPGGFSLETAYPNPFNPVTTISYYLPHDSQVKLTVYALNGQEVTTLVNQVETGGYHEVRLNFNEFDLPSSIYFYSLEAPGCKMVQKVMYIK